MNLSGKRIEQMAKFPVPPKNVSKKKINPFAKKGNPFAKMPPKGAGDPKGQVIWSDRSKPPKEKK